MSVVLFAGGGTGGHLMPALAIAEAMVRLDPSVEPFFLGARRGIEAQVLPARPWRHALLPFEPIYRRQWWRNWRLPLSAWRSHAMVRDVLEREGPALAVGTGGYVSGPAVWAAARAGVPYLLQEQNAFPGFATRRLARQARQIHLGFPEAARYLEPGPETVVSVTGNPIVPPVEPRPARGAAKQALGFAADRPLVLVAGGSQGSLAINRVVAGAVTSGRWPGGTQLLWQTGQASHGDFAHLGTATVRLSPFIDPMAMAYAAADLVVCRGGALTLAEVAAWALPAIVVPLPTSAANHQLVNARALAAAGAAVLREQRDLDADSLVTAVTGLLDDPAGMARLAAAGRGRARPLAADNIAAAALALLPNS